jgi:hypothetical protein
MALPRCDQCDNWKLIGDPAAPGDAVELGHCHARPPRVVAAIVQLNEAGGDDVEHLALWPITRAHDGCRVDFTPRLDADKLVRFGT